MYILLAKGLLSFCCEKEFPLQKILIDFIIVFVVVFAVAVIVICIHKFVWVVVAVLVIVFVADNVVIVVLIVVAVIVLAVIADIIREIRILSVYEDVWVLHVTGLAVDPKLVAVALPVADYGHARC